MIRKSLAFTLIELLCVCCCLVLVLAIMLVAIQKRSPSRSQMLNSVILRSVHTALILYSQGNAGYFPGMDDRGNLLPDSSVEHRYQIILENEYITSKDLISPDETVDKYLWKAGRVTTDMYSFSLLNLSDIKSVRLNEWRDTSNSEAAVACNRAIDNGANHAIRGIHTQPDIGRTEWRGSIAFNDNHVTFEATHDQLDTVYCEESFENDNLFDTVGASMVYEGVNKIVDSGK